MSNHMHIWEFNRTLAYRLLYTNLVNFWIGRRLRESRRKFLRGAGTQAVGWSIINITIALFGIVTTQRRLDRLDDPFEPDAIRRETRNIRLVLLVNTPMNLLYMLGGRRFARSGKKKGDNFRRGSGWGIMLQGAMLFAHDVYHLMNIPDGASGKD